MNAEEIRAFALSKPNVTEGFPFGEDTLVFKVNGKVFLLVNLTSESLQFNVKCDPERALALREEYENILPGYHMNKQHWNTIITGHALSNQLLQEMINHSYELVSIKKKIKATK